MCVWSHLWIKVFYVVKRRSPVFPALLAFPLPVVLPGIKKSCGRELALRGAHTAGGGAATGFSAAAYAEIAHWRCVGRKLLGAERELLRRWFNPVAGSTRPSCSPL